MFLRPDAHATLLVAEPEPGRRMALWPPRPDAAATETVRIFDRGQPCDIVAEVVPLARLIDELVNLPARAEADPTVRAWSTAAKIAVDLIGRGHLRPGTTPTGRATWLCEPHDRADVKRNEQLVAALPAAAHSGATTDDLILTAHAAVTVFQNAIADALVRTTAAAVVTGNDAFAASSSAVELDDETAEWLAAVDVAPTTVATVVRISPPVEGEAFRAEVLLGIDGTTDNLVDVAAVWTSDELDEHLGPEPELGVVRALQRARSFWAPAHRLLEQQIPGHVDLHDDEVADLLGPAADDLAYAGIDVVWPDDLTRTIELIPVVRPVEAEAPALVDGGMGAGVLARPNELHWIAALDGIELTAAEIEQLHRLERPLARVRDRWVRIDPLDLARIGLTEDLSSGQALAAALSGTVAADGRLYEATVVGPIAVLAERLHNLERADAPEPVGLDGTLREYQERGLAWLHEMAELGLGGVLADDMGLGKTVQLLALHLAHAKTHPRPTLVVCPATLIGNWEREAASFAPGIPIRRYHGTDRSLDDVASNEIVVVTYGVVRRDAETLSEVKWGLVVADEAQVIKNPLSLTARELRRIPTQTRFALTGTPVENRLDDLWALLDWTTPGLLGTLSRFRRDIAVPIERNQDEAAASSFSRLIQPFVLRRRKTDPSIAPELPPKTETDQIVQLTTEQSALYKQIADEVLADIAAAEGMSRRGLVLRLLTALKQICNHPAHFLGEAGPLRGRSGKLASVDELLDVIVAEGDATLIFTQYVAMGRLLEAHLNERGLTTEFLHGKVPVGKRQAMVDRFQDGQADVFVISLKAGGTGLNLTQATHVIHYDRWWNPAVEDQASDRAWRIGQDRPVQVHRMMCEDTLEDRIGAVLEGKRALAEAVVGGGEAWISELTDSELSDLVSLGATGGESE